MLNRQYFSPKRVTVMFPKGNDETAYFEYTGRATLLIMIHRRGTNVKKSSKKIKQHRPRADGNKNAFELFPSITLPALSL
jgi:hypothetical protein